MESYYEINVSLNGRHLFATAPRSAKTEAEVDRIMKVFIKKFPKEEGFKIMNQALEEVKNTIKAKNGSYLLETKPMVIGGDEKSLSEQLREMKNSRKKRQPLL